MSEITLEAIAQLLNHEFKPLKEIKETLNHHTEVLNQHTTALDMLIKNTSNWNAEMTVMRDKLEKHEKIITMFAEKLGLDVKELLH